MVLSCLSLTTVPWSWRFGIALEPLLRLRRRPLAGTLLRGDGLDPGDVAAHLAHARCILELTGGPLETQVEPLLLELHELVVELVGGHRPEVVGFHHSAPYSAM